MEENELESLTIYMSVKAKQRNFLFSQKYFCGNRMYIYDTQSLIKIKFIFGIQKKNILVTFLFIAQIPTRMHTSSLLVPGVLPRETSDNFLSMLRYLKKMKKIKFEI